jgi:hypothetical protein
MNSSPIDDAIETICQRGCRYVNTLLADPKRQAACADLRALDREQRLRVLEELRGVMAVYLAAGSCEL